MKGEVIGSIEPWDDDNAQIPAHLFQKRVKTLNSDTSKNKFLGLSRTEETVIRKLKTDENGIYFRKTGQKIFTVDFHRCRDSNSNLKKALCAARREEIVLVGRKKSIKGMEINSIKKKIMDFDIY
jgi:endo-alpha-1,4-polygalactosaminidase (GH114 family)